MAQLTGGQAVVKSLIAQGVDTVFGLPGMQLDHLFAAFYDDRNAVRMIHTRHEQGAAYMAFGYAQSTGKVGVFTVVPGPGLLNAGAGLATAFGCSQKVMCVTGQIPSPFIGRGIGYLHEIDNQLGILQSLTKFAGRANHPARNPASDGGGVPPDAVGPAAPGGHRGAARRAAEAGGARAGRPMSMAWRIPCRTRTRSRARQSFWARRRTR